MSPKMFQRFFNLAQAMGLSKEFKEFCAPLRLLEACALTSNPFWWKRLQAWAAPQRCLGILESFFCGGPGLVHAAGFFLVVQYSPKALDSKLLLSTKALRPCDSFW